MFIAINLLICLFGCLLIRPSESILQFLSGEAIGIPVAFEQWFPKRSGKQLSLDDRCLYRCVMRHRSIHRLSAGEGWSSNHSAQIYSHLNSKSDYNQHDCEHVIYWSCARAMRVNPQPAMDMYPRPCAVLSVSTAADTRCHYIPLCLRRPFDLK
jgi:hypothetical protein